jgi:4-hydroxy-2-oxoheptanedioate aldolase
VSIRSELHDRETLGGWCAIPNWLSAEIVGRAGFDWVCVDTQHGPIGVSEMASMLQALSAAGVPALVRVPWNEPAAIYRALDAGASGVIVPLVNSPGEAEAAAQACRFAPAGTRSYGPTVAALRHPAFGAETANGEVVCIVQIETEEAISSVDAIAGVEGIDGLFVGPADLGLSIGTPAGDVTNERFRDATRRVVRAALDHHKVPAIFCGTIDAALTARSDGFRMLAVQSDVRLLRAAASEAIARLRAREG